MVMAYNISCMFVFFPSCIFFSLLLSLFYFVLQESISQVRPLVICHCNPADTPTASDNHPDKGKWSRQIWSFSHSLPLFFFLFLLPLFISIIIVFFSFLFPLNNTWHTLQQIPQGILFLLMRILREAQKLALKWKCNVWYMLASGYLLH